jgi:hypothetical protein
LEVLLHIILIYKKVCKPSYLIVPELLDMGLILAFDLDQTLAHTTDLVYFNFSIVHILNSLVKKALRGSVIDGIFLLTNNDNKDYVKLIDESLKNALKSTGAFRGGEGYPVDTYFFDYIMDYTHSRRHPNKTKSYADIKFMADVIGIRYNDDNELLRRTYFFDDLIHDLNGEMIAAGLPDHYIQITPPFENKAPDSTNYEPVKAAINTEEQAMNSEMVKTNKTFRIKGGKRSYKKRKTRRLRR